MSGNPTALTLEDPLQVDEARRATRIIAVRRRAAREALREAEEGLAEAERLYRKARAVAYVVNKGAPSAGMRDAMVDDETADARYERDVARGLVNAQSELLKELDGERASLHRLIDWSMKLDPYAVEGQS
jgi:hypothetical protein